VGSGHFKASHEQDESHCLVLENEDRRGGRCEAVSGKAGNTSSMGLQRLHRESRPRSTRSGETTKVKDEPNKELKQRPAVLATSSRESTMCPEIPGNTDAYESLHSIVFKALALYRRQGKEFELGRGQGRTEEHLSRSGQVQDMTRKPKARAVKGREEVI
jgi:hypothetical protein